LLSAKWKAQKTQRDEAAAEKTQQEMNDLITKMKDPNYTKAMRTKEGIEATGSLIVQAARDKNESGGKTTITELKTKLTVAEDKLATELGVPRAKINEAILALKKKADRNDADAAKKLKNLESYRDDVQRAQETISRWNVKNPDSSSSSSSSSSSKKPLGEFNK